MADSMRYTTMLPAIKCSNCGLELEISMMGDHICDTDALDVPPVPQVQETTHMPPPNLYQQRDEYRMPIRRKPSYIDAEIANSYPAHREPLTPSSPYGYNRGIPSNSNSNGNSPEYYIPQRSSSVPIPPPSPAASEFAYHQQESSYHRSPLERSQTSPSTKSGTNPRVAPTANAPSEVYSQIPPVPPSPKPTGGANILKRMNTMARGPFSKSRRSGSDRSSHLQQNADIHKRADSGASLYDGDRVITNNEVPMVPSLPSPAFQHEPRTPSPFGNPPSSSSPSTGSPKVDVYGRPLPTGPAPPRPMRPDAANPYAEEMNSDPYQSTRDPTENQYRRDPQLTTSTVPGQTANYLDEPQQKSSQANRLSTNFSTSPLAQSPRTAPVDSSRSSSTTRQTAFEELSPEPSNHVQDYEVGNPYHTPSESASSIGSVSRPGTRTASSRSSPPTSNASSFSQKHRSHGQNDVPETIDEHLTNDEEYQRIPPQNNTSNPTSPISPDHTTLNHIQQSPNLSSNLSRPRLPEPSGTTPDSISQQPLTPLESPVDPNLHQRSIQAQQTYFPTMTAPRAPTQAAWPPPPAIPESPPRAPRRAAANKSCCRGCTLPITGKSVKAADGRLSGRYHKECFVCKTCKEPFQTADFYVINNHPYCGHHYHYLNNSLCSLCNVGIEGQFLETVDKKKFHSECFVCQECHQPLLKDYFDINGRNYCEEDARTVHARNNRLGAGRRFPERRTTKLMMM